MQRKYEATAMIGFLLVVAALGIGLAPMAGANHDSDANFTVQPVDAPEDRQPGIADASYKQFATGNVNIEKLDYFVVSSAPGDSTGCSSDNIEQLGFDRGGDNPGTEVDEGMLQYVQDQQRTEDKLVVKFYDDNAVGGETTYYNASDEIVSYVADCVGNPEEPGWYQIDTKVNGTGYDGQRMEVSVSSHYYWICDCASESEAREQLGPPPSQTPTQTDRPDETATETSTESTATEATQTGTPTETESDESTSTQTAGSGGEDTDDATTEAGATEAQTDATEDTPSPGDGTGFGPLVAVGALLASSLLALRRR